MLAILLWCLLSVTVIGLVLGGIVVIFGHQLLAIYNPDPEVIAYGFERLQIIALTYFLCGVMDVVTGSIRGLGPSVTPTVISLTGICLLRIVWIYTIFAVRHDLFTLYLSYPVSWIITFAANIACFAFFFVRWRKRVEAVPST